MIRVVDSSAWIEWTSDGLLASVFKGEIPDQKDCVVPTIVQYEMLKWLARELGENEADDFIAFTQECVVVELDTPIALLASELGHKHKLSAADAIIYATAVQHEAELLTCDAHFKDLPGVIYIPKPVN